MLLTGRREDAPQSPHMQTYMYVQVYGCCCCCCFVTIDAVVAISENAHHRKASRIDDLTDAGRDGRRKKRRKKKTVWFSQVACWLCRKWHPFRRLRLSAHPSSRNPNTRREPTFFLGGGGRGETNIFFIFYRYHIEVLPFEALFCCFDKTKKQQIQSRWSPKGLLTASPAVHTMPKTHSMFAHHVELLFEVLSLSVSLPLPPCLYLPPFLSFFLFF